jgi:hypothetical protein
VKLALRQLNPSHVGELSRYGCGSQLRKCATTNLAGSKTEYRFGPGRRGSEAPFASREGAPEVAGLAAGPVARVLLSQRAPLGSRAIRVRADPLDNLRTRSAVERVAPGLAGRGNGAAPRRRSAGSRRAGGRRPGGSRAGRSEHHRTGRTRDRSAVHPETVAGPVVCSPEGCEQEARPVGTPARCPAGHRGWHTSGYGEHPLAGAALGWVPVRRLPGTANRLVPRTAGVKIMAAGRSAAVPFDAQA